MSFLSKLHFKIARRLSRGPRGDYKSFWSRVSLTEYGAKMVVSGSEDEAEYDRTGRETRDMLQSTVGIQPSDIVLEIGAGVGRVGKFIAPICKEWIGADVSPNMLRHIRRRLAGLSNIRTVELNGYDLAPIPSASVDVAYCTVVFMHLDEWDRYNYVLEGFRVLKPGGRMLIDNFNLLSDEGWQFFIQHKLAHAPDKRPPHISKASTPQELHAYLQRAGFQNIRQTNVGLWTIAWAAKP